MTLRKYEGQPGWSWTGPCPWDAGDGTCGYPLCAFCGSGDRRLIPCERSEEYCTGCGRRMVRTFEVDSLYDRKTGRKPTRIWHSCPRYFMSWWRNLLTLGTGGMGHDSHSETNALLGRTYR